ncbi:hypothetical protein [Methylobacterium soli]|uniref:Uncharacterized protein n=1 Tax=Methylobacterium soli TaxID=553447 RepID=A0A6L3T614_9HYPH|nr:hypothetical protein [Methylobacterium soli]KAB1080574.1 hypothetical protein F6X53_05120 [Methylobacterium soli]GJE43575.1 hypothetical protein AEGHOMDF_2754 [Methylobacterium soli]
MGKGRKVLSDDHARALIKQAVGIVFGDQQTEAEATAEIDAIEAAHVKASRKTKRTRPPPA